VECYFSSYDEFKNEYENYRFDDCSDCEGICELVESDVTCIIEGKILKFSYITLQKMWKRVPARTYKTND